MFCGGVCRVGTIALELGGGTVSPSVRQWFEIKRVLYGFVDDFGVYFVDFD